MPCLYSIGDHMYRMSILALCCSDPNLDIAKYVAESIFMSPKTIDLLLLLDVQ